MAKKIPVRAKVTFNAYTIVEEAVRAGLLGFLWNEDHPVPKTQIGAENIAERGVTRVMNNLAEVLKFE